MARQQLDDARQHLRNIDSTDPKILSDPTLTQPILKMSAGTFKYNSTVKIPKPTHQMNE